MKAGEEALVTEPDTEKKVKDDTIKMNGEADNGDKPSDENHVENHNNVNGNHNPDVEAEGEQETDDREEDQLQNNVEQNGHSDDEDGDADDDDLEGEKLFSEDLRDMCQIRCRECQQIILAYQMDAHVKRRHKQLVGSYGKYEYVKKTYYRCKICSDEILFGFNYISAHVDKQHEMDLRKYKELHMGIDPDKNYKELVEMIEQQAKTDDQPAAEESKEDSPAKTDKYKMIVDDELDDASDAANGLGDEVHIKEEDNFDEENTIVIEGEGVTEHDIDHNREAVGELETGNSDEEDNPMEIEFPGSLEEEYRPQIIDSNLIGSDSEYSPDNELAGSDEEYIPEPLRAPGTGKKKSSRKRSRTTEPTRRSVRTKLDKVEPTDFLELIDTSETATENEEIEIPDVEIIVEKVYSDDPEKVCRVRCDDCRQRMSANAFENHARRSHRGKNPDKTIISDIYHRCKICDEAMLWTPDTVLEHLKLSHYNTCRSWAGYKDKYLIIPSKPSRPSPAPAPKKIPIVKITQPSSGRGRGSRSNPPPRTIIVNPNSAKDARSAPRIVNRTVASRKLSDDLVDLCTVYCAVCKDEVLRDDIFTHTSENHPREKTAAFKISKEIYHRCKICRTEVLFSEKMIASHLKKHAKLCGSWEEYKHRFLEPQKEDDIEKITPDVVIHGDHDPISITDDVPAITITADDPNVKSTASNAKTVSKGGSQANKVGEKVIKKDPVKNATSKVKTEVTETVDNPVKVEPARNEAAAAEGGNNQENVEVVSCEVDQDFIDVISEDTQDESSGNITEDNMAAMAEMSEIDPDYFFGMFADAQAPPSSAEPTKRRRRTKKVFSSDLRDLCTVSCDWCGQVMLKNNFSSHSSTKHQGMRSKFTPVKTTYHRCQLCGNGILFCSRSMRVHLSNNHKQLNISWLEYKRRYLMNNMMDESQLYADESNPDEMDEISALKTSMTTTSPAPPPVVDEFKQEVVDTKPVVEPISSSEPGADNMPKNCIDPLGEALIDTVDSVATIEEDAKMYSDDIHELCEVRCSICSEVINRKFKSVHQKLHPYKECQFFFTKITFHRCKLCSSSLLFCVASVSTHLRDAHKTDLNSWKGYKQRYLYGTEAVPNKQADEPSNNVKVVTAPVSAKQPSGDGETTIPITSLSVVTPKTEVDTTIRCSHCDFTGTQLQVNFHLREQHLELSLQDDEIKQLEEIENQVIPENRIVVTKLEDQSISRCLICGLQGVHLDVKNHVDGLHANVQGQRYEMVQATYTACILCEKTVLFSKLNISVHLRQNHPGTSLIDYWKMMETMIKSQEEAEAANAAALAESVKAENLHTCQLCGMEMPLDRVSVECHIQEYHFGTTTGPLYWSYIMSHPLDENYLASDSDRRFSDRLEDMCKIQCNLCSEAVPTNYKWYHMKSVHKEVPQEEWSFTTLEQVHHRCKLCGKELLFKMPILASHMKRIHAYDINEYKKQYLISNTSEKAEVEAESMASERVYCDDPAEMSIVLCLLCDRELYRHCLSNHMVVNHSQVEGKYKQYKYIKKTHHRCKLCRKTCLFDSNSLRIHLKTHATSLPDYLHNYLSSTSPSKRIKVEKEAKQINQEKKIAKEVKFINEATEIRELKEAREDAEDVKDAGSPAVLDDLDSENLFSTNVHNMCLCRCLFCLEVFTMHQIRYHVYNKHREYATFSDEEQYDIVRETFYRCKICRTSLLFSLDNIFLHVKNFHYMSLNDYKEKYMGYDDNKYVYRKRTYEGEIFPDHLQKKMLKLGLRFRTRADNTTAECDTRAEDGLSSNNKILNNVPDVSKEHTSLASEDSSTKKCTMDLEGGGISEVDTNEQNTSSVTNENAANIKLMNDNNGFEETKTNSDDNCIEESHDTNEKDEMKEKSKRTMALPYPVKRKRDSELDMPEDEDTDQSAPDVVFKCPFPDCLAYTSFQGLKNGLATDHCWNVHWLKPWQLRRKNLRWCRISWESLQQLSTKLS